MDELNTHHKENDQFLTPILFLIFNRSQVTTKVFNQIRLIKPKYLYVAADGPRFNSQFDTIACEETRKIIQHIDWDCELKTLFRDKNLGCGIAVHSAITWFFENVETGIILEDDCFPNTTFFQYCAELLIKYKNYEEIKFIGGNNFQNGIKRGESSYYFSHYPTSWGWAAWRRSWLLFNPDINDFKSNLTTGYLDHIFNSSNEKKYWFKKLSKANKEGDNIWDFHFYYSIWKARGLCITPNVNLVINIGFFEDATHYFLKDTSKTKVKCEMIDFPLIHPDIIKVDRVADKYTFDHFYSHSIRRIGRLLKENNFSSIYHYCAFHILQRLKKLRI